MHWNQSHEPGIQYKFPQWVAGIQSFQPLMLPLRIYISVKLEPGVRNSNLEHRIVASISPLVLMSATPNAFSILRKSTSRGILQQIFLSLQMKFLSRSELNILKPIGWDLSLLLNAAVRMFLVSSTVCCSGLTMAEGSLLFLPLRGKSPILLHLNLD